ncbi:MAG: hypothetical protein COX72_08435 [Gammaproteobacteria bacterium CG_4_10_14_0_2_um_filter_38_22]|nr:MAG: hypothetical protein COX72_08435 [Gammaproteobacteria bacterium CG_4_10_14_0_2_um_filter_38_22]
MINRKTLNVLILLVGICTISPVIAKSVCTPSPTSIHLSVGKSAKVQYNCSAADRYTLRFNYASSNADLKVDRPPSFSSNPYTITVTGKVAGVYSVVADTIYFGAGPHFSVTNGSPLKVTVGATPTPVLQSITVSPSTASVAVGNTTSAFTADCTYSTGEAACPSSLTWSSSDTQVATINATSGVATGVAAGSSNITATADSITSASPAVLTVTAAPPGDVIATSTTCSIVAGATSVECGVTYTNNSLKVIKIKKYTATNPNGGTVTSPTTASCAQLSPSNQAGNSCMVNYTFKPTYAPGFLPPASFNTTMTYGSSKTQLPFSVPLKFTPAVSVTSFSCEPMQITAGDVSNCTLELNSVNANTISSITLSPTATAGELVATQGNPKLIATGINTFNFTYTAPQSISEDSSSVTVSYSDDVGDNNIIATPVVIALTSPVTVSGIRCYPNPGIPGNNLNCNIVLTNTGSSKLSIATPTITIAGETANLSNSSCLTALKPNEPCTISFSGATPSTPSVVIEVKPAKPDRNLFNTQSDTLTVFSNNAPHIQANPITCKATQLALSAATQCTVLVRNLGTTVATGVTMTPTAAQGVISESTTTCSGVTSGQMSSGDTCTNTFTYTAPSATSNQNSDKISVAYSDDQNSYPAFLNSISILLLSNANLEFTGTVIPNSADAMPLNQVEYGSTLKVIFQFMNNSSSTFNFDAPQVVAIVNGQVKQLPNAIETGSVNSSCLAGDMVKNSGCTLTVDFTPDNFNGFKIGDHVVLTAWLPSANGSPIATWDATIGDAPIFTDVFTNHLFANESGKTLKGAFVFGNNTTNSLTNLRSVRAFLPAGFSESTACPSGVASKYTDIVPCAGLNTLSSNSYCYACFTKNNSDSLTPNTNLTFEAQLSYDQSVSTTTRIVPVTPSYRKFTLKNACTGPVWPAFVSGSAYYFCAHNSDCPAGTQCYKPGHQCQVPASIDPLQSGGCPPGTYTYPGSIQCSPGCNTAKTGGTLVVCPSHSTCNPNNGLCYWNLPEIVSGMQSDLKISPNTTAVVQIPNSPLVKAGNWSATWSGGLVGRTGCKKINSTFICDTGSCAVKDAGTDNSCLLGTAPQTPATQAEFTLLYRNQDYYDVEIINGFSIPVSMKPDAPTYTGSTPVVSSPYTCNVAGEQISGTPSNTCPWHFTMNSYDLLNGSTATPYGAYYQALHTYVSTTAAAQTCTPGANSCTAPELCGLTQANSTIPQVPAGSGPYVPTFTCGKLIGFWSTNQLCGANSQLNYTAPDSYKIDCAAEHGGNTLSAWLGCNAGSAASSCYTQNAGSGCCGCPYWSAGSKPDQKNQPSEYFKTVFPNGFVLSPNGNDDYCQANSTDWTSNVQNESLVWMKQGCSSTYTFAYDDPTSTFTCSSNSVKNGQPQNPAGLVNTQDYTVTFCPNNNQGEINSNPVYVAPDLSGQSASLSIWHRWFSFKKMAHEIKRDLHWI